MPGIQVAESTKPKRGRKTLDHLELHPKMGGGHIVKHIFTDYEHRPEEYHFNENGKGKGGEHILKHLQKHAGLPLMASAEGNGGSPTTEEEE